MIGGEGWAIGEQELELSGVGSLVKAGGGGTGAIGGDRVVVGCGVVWCM